MITLEAPPAKAAFLCPLLLLAALMSFVVMDHRRVPLLERRSQYGS
jgi:hypothetical protein